MKKLENQGFYTKLWKIFPNNIRFWFEIMIDITAMKKAVLPRSGAGQPKGSMI